MRLLFIASEATPLVKVGGLADVVGALPPALRALGHDARVLLPKYSTIAAATAPELRRSPPVLVPWQNTTIPVTVIESTIGTTNVPLYLLSAPGIFDGDAIYYEHSGPGGMRLAEERYVFFSLAVTKILPALDWQPEVVHCHDWHTGLVPALVPKDQPSVFTIHNMEGQGKWRAEEVFSWLGLPAPEQRRFEHRDLENNLNLLQLGIRHATAVNTVSPTYAKEICQPLYGLGLERDIIARPNGVQGIVNGIDVDTFNPATDKHIAYQYTLDTAAAEKRRNRQALHQELGLKQSPGPCFGLVGRITNQKGIDLVIGTLRLLVEAGANVIVLGSGTPALEQRLAQIAAPYHSSVRIVLKFDAALAQRIYAASDFFLMPSRFEPCGLGQMIAMRYGAIPVVRDTGGLHDTVRDARHDARGTGLVFSEPTVAAFTVALKAALRIYHEHGTLDAVRRRAMTEDFSWQRSAVSYEHLYRYVQDHAANK